MSEREEHCGVVLEEGDVKPTQDPKGRPTFLVTGTHRNGGGSQTSTLHLSYVAAVAINRKLSDTL
ncbi:hypothetical protein [Streptomyces sp. CBMA370]|uniref:hypothetical protein n=1 Tax=Streptomyces sp. CBMA370 TaxID=1930278 RepID=UPI0016619CFB|nr:hypothetical protein [Streptomyces sp. CBMA370]